MDATKRERRGEHADVLPVELLLLLTLDEDLGETMGHVFTGVHALLDRSYHRTVDLDEVVVELGGASVHFVGKPLKRFEEIDQVSEWTCITVMVRIARALVSLNATYQ